MDSLDPFANHTGIVLEPSPEQGPTPEYLTTPEYMDTPNGDRSPQDDTDGYPGTPPNSLGFTATANITQAQFTNFDSPEMLQKIVDKKAQMEVDYEVTDHSRISPDVPQNSFNETFLKSDMHDLPSFMNAEMLQKIQSKKAAFNTNDDSEDFRDETNSFPFTPQNSYADGNLFDMTGDQVHLPSFHNAEMVEKIKVKKASLGALDEMEEPEETPCISGNPFTMGEAADIGDDLVALDKETQESDSDHYLFTPHHSSVQQLDGFASQDLLNITNNDLSNKEDEEKDIPSNNLMNEDVGIVDQIANTSGSESPAPVELYERDLETPDTALNNRTGNVVAYGITQEILQEEHPTIQLETEIHNNDCDVVTEETDIDIENLNSEILSDLNVLNHNAIDIHERGVDFDDNEIKDNVIASEIAEELETNIPSSTLNERDLEYVESMKTSERDIISIEPSGDVSCEISDSDIYESNVDSDEIEDNVIASQIVEELETGKPFATLDERDLEYVESTKRTERDSISLEPSGEVMGGDIDCEIAENISQSNNHTTDISESIRKEPLAINENLILQNIEIADVRKNSDIEEYDQQSHMGELYLVDDFSQNHSVHGEANNESNDVEFLDQIIETSDSESQAPMELYERDLETPDASLNDIMGNVVAYGITQDILQEENPTNQFETEMPDKDFPADIFSEKTDNDIDDSVIANSDEEIVEDLNVLNHNVIDNYENSVNSNDNEIKDNVIASQIADELKTDIHLSTSDIHERSLDSDDNEINDNVIASQIEYELKTDIPFLASDIHERSLDSDDYEIKDNVIAFQITEELKTDIPSDIHETSLDSDKNKIKDNVIASQIADELKTNEHMISTSEIRERSLDPDDNEINDNVIASQIADELKTDIHLSTSDIRERSLDSDDNEINDNVIASQIDYELKTDIYLSTSDIHERSLDSEDNEINDNVIASQIADEIKTDEHMPTSDIRENGSDSDDNEINDNVNASQIVDELKTDIHLSTSDIHERSLDSDEKEIKENVIASQIADELKTDIPFSASDIHETRLDPDDYEITDNVNASHIADELKTDIPFSTSDIRENIFDSDDNEIKDNVIASQIAEELKTDTPFSASDILERSLDSDDNEIKDNVIASQIADELKTDEHMISTSDIRERSLDLDDNEIKDNVIASQIADELKTDEHMSTSDIRERSLDSDKNEIKDNVIASEIDELKIDRPFSASDIHETSFNPDDDEITDNVIASQIADELKTDIPFSTSDIRETSFDPDDDTITDIPENILYSDDNEIKDNIIASQIAEELKTDIPFSASDIHERNLNSNDNEIKDNVIASQIAEELKTDIPFSTSDIRETSFDPDDDTITDIVNASQIAEELETDIPFSTSDFHERSLDLDVIEIRDSVIASQIADELKTDKHLLTSGIHERSLDSDDNEIKDNVIASKIAEDLKDDISSSPTDIHEVSFDSYDNKIKDNVVASTIAEECIPFSTSVIHGKSLDLDDNEIKDNVIDYTIAKEQKSDILPSPTDIYVKSVHSDDNEIKDTVITSQIAEEFKADITFSSPLIRDFENIESVETIERDILTRKPSGELIGGISASDIYVEDEPAAINVIEKPVLRDTEVTDDIINSGIDDDQQSLNITKQSPLGSDYNNLTEWIEPDIELAGDCTESSGNVMAYSIAKELKGSEANGLVSREEKGIFGAASGLTLLPNASDPYNVISAPSQVTESAAEVQPLSDFPPTSAQNAASSSEADATNISIFEVEGSAGVNGEGDLRLGEHSDPQLSGGLADEKVDSAMTQSAQVADVRPVFGDTGSKVCGESSQQQLPSSQSKAADNLSAADSASLPDSLVAENTDSETVDLQQALQVADSLEPLSDNISDNTSVLSNVVAASVANDMIHVHAVQHDLDTNPSADMPTNGYSVQQDREYEIAEQLIEEVIESAVEIYKNDFDKNDYDDTNGTLLETNYLQDVDPLGGNLNFLRSNNIVTSAEQLPAESDSFNQMSPQVELTGGREDVLGEWNMGVTDSSTSGVTVSSASSSSLSPDDMKLDRIVETDYLSNVDILGGRLNLLEENSQGSTEVPEGSSFQKIIETSAPVEPDVGGDNIVLGHELVQPSTSEVSSQEHHIDLNSENQDVFGMEPFEHENKTEHSICVNDVILTSDPFSSNMDPFAQEDPFALQSPDPFDGDPFASSLRSDVACTEKRLSQIEEETNSASVSPSGTLDRKTVQISIPSEDLTEINQPEDGIEDVIGVTTTVQTPPDIREQRETAATGIVAGAMTAAVIQFQQAEQAEMPQVKHQQRDSGESVEANTAVPAKSSSVVSRHVISYFFQKKKITYIILNIFIRELKSDDTKKPIGKE